MILSAWENMKDVSLEILLVFWTECQVARRCQQSLCVPECFYELFYENEISKLSVLLKWELGAGRCFGGFVVVEIMHKQDNSVLMFIVVIVDGGSKKCKAIQKVERESRFFSQEFLRITSRSHGLNSLVSWPNIK